MYASHAAAGQSEEVGHGGQVDHVHPLLESVHDHAHAVLEEDATRGLQSTGSNPIYSDPNSALISYATSASATSVLFLSRIPAEALGGSLQRGDRLQGSAPQSSW